MNTKYHISQLKKFKNLELSLEKTNQIEPIIVFIDSENKEYIVDGIKRTVILEKLNKKIEKKTFKDLLNLLAFVLDSKEIHESSLWKFFHLLKENNIKEEEIFSSVIKARLKLSIRDIWKALEINFSEKTYNLLTQLNMSIKELITYYQVESEDFDSLLELFLSINANKNNRKDLFNLINELLKIKKISFKDLLKDSSIDSVLSSNLQKNDKMNSLKKSLFNLRNPNMSQEIEQLTALKNKIKTPGLKLDLPVDKESIRSNISFQFKNFKELEKKVNALNKLLSDENLKEVLNQIENR